MIARLLFVHALTPLHPGTGQGVGVVDLPVAREKATGLPYLPGSSIKGPLRDACHDGGLRKAIFGPDTSNADEHASSVQFTDARLLLLPVRSLAGTFAWATTTFILQRLARDAEDVGDTVPPGIPPVGSDQAVVSTAEPHALVVPGAGKICLEDLDLTPTQNDLAEKWSQWLVRRVPGVADVLPGRLCILHESVFAFLAEHGTEVRARVALDEKKTVKRGQLWYEESLPAETVLSGLVLATDSRDPNAPQKAKAILDEVQKLTAQVLQLGGKATVGHGLCHVTIPAVQTTTPAPGQPTPQPTGTQR